MERRLGAERALYVSAIELQDGPVKQGLVARELTGDEKAEWWVRCVAGFPNYADYQRKTTREIPVFLLEPVSG
jgi:F420H(2)-dependent quinone reductase